MRAFTAKVATSDGVQVLLISAKSTEEAVESARTVGLVLECYPDSSLRASRPLNSEEREHFFTQLAFMLSSGIGVSEALGVLRKSYKGKMSHIAAELQYLVETGSTLHAAFRKIGERDFPASSLALLEAGYRAGEGANSLKQAAAFEANVRELQQTSGAGLLSALIGFVVAALTIGVSMLWVGPTVLNSELIKAGGDNVNVGWALVSGQILGVLMTALLLGLIFLFFVSKVVRKTHPLIADKITNSVIIWRDVSLAKERFLVFFGLGALIRSGISLEQSFQLLEQGTTPGRLKGELSNALRAIKNGHPWSPEMSSLSAVDQAALKNASDRTAIAQTFLALSERHKINYTRSLQTASTLLQSISGLCLALGGGLMFALAILPVLQASMGIGD